MVNPAQQNVITAFAALDGACSHQTNLLCLKASKALKAAGIEGFRAFAGQVPANLLPHERDDRRLRSVIARLSEESASEVAISFREAQKLLAKGPLSFSALAQRVLGESPDPNRAAMICRPPASCARAYRRAAQEHTHSRASAQPQAQEKPTPNPRPAAPNPPPRRTVSKPPSPRDMGFWNKMFVAVSATAVMALAAHGVFGDMSLPDGPRTPQTITQKVPAGIFGP